MTHESDFTKTSEYSDVILKEYFLYDPDTFLFLGNISAVSQPNNSTLVPAFGFFNTPKWDPLTEKWSDPTNKNNDEKIAEIAQTLATSKVEQNKTNALLLKKIAELTIEKENTNG